MTATRYARLTFLSVLTLAVIGMGSAARAQQAADKPAPVLPTIPVRVDVTMTRFQGEKKVSSLPFSLYASATPYGRQQPVSLRMGIDVPVGKSTSTETRNSQAPANTTPTNSTATTSTKVDYRNVGTNIDCWATRIDETHFSVYVSVNDSSIYSADGDTKNLKNLDPAAFRTFSTSNTVVLRDGQTLLFGTGTDKVSGEVLKIEVTLTAIK